MAAVITQDSRTVATENFMERFGKSASTSTLYMGIGRSATWLNEQLPPAPENTVDAVDNFWTDFLAMQRINTSDIAIAVARYNWVSGDEYFVFDLADDQSFQSKFYTVNSENRVYKVVSKTPSATTITEPLGHNNGVDINTGDGYVWKFLYTISATDITNEMITDEFIPVNYDSRIVQEQIDHGDINAYKTLFANHILVKADINDPIISTSLVYRQVAILSDVLDLGDAVFTGTAGLAANLQQSGYVLHLENKKPIYRADAQKETIHTVIKFY